MFIPQFFASPVLFYAGYMCGHTADIFFLFSALVHMMIAIKKKLFFKFTCIQSKIHVVTIRFIGDEICNVTRVHTFQKSRITIEIVKFFKL